MAENDPTSPQGRAKEDEYARIGKIIVNWSTADHILGRVLEDVVLGGQRNTDIYKWKIADKVKEIALRRSHLPDEKEIEVIVRELKIAVDGDPWTGRNLVAHGILLFPSYGDEDAFFYSRNRDEFLCITTLPNLHEWSRYAALLSKRLWVLAHGGQPDGPLPVRPVVLPQRQSAAGSSMNVGGQE